MLFKYAVYLSITISNNCRHFIKQIEIVSKLALTPNRTKNTELSVLYHLVYFYSTDVIKLKNIEGFFRYVYVCIKPG